MNLDSLQVQLDTYIQESGKTEEQALNSVYIRFNKDGFTIEKKDSLWTKIKTVFLKGQYDFGKNFAKIVQDFPKEVKDDAQVEKLNTLSKELTSILNHVNARRKEKHKSEYDFKLPRFTLLSQETQKQAAPKQAAQKQASPQPASQPSPKAPPKPASAKPAPTPQTVPQEPPKPAPQPQPVPKEPSKPTPAPQPAPQPSAPAHKTGPKKITEVRKTALEMQLYGTKKTESTPEPEAPTVVEKKIQKPKPPKRTHQLSAEQAQQLLKQDPLKKPEEAVTPSQAKEEVDIEAFEYKLSQLEGHASPGTGWRLLGYSDNPLLQELLVDIKKQPPTESLVTLVDYLLDAHDSSSSNYNAARRIEAVLFAETLLEKIDAPNTMEDIAIFRSCVDDLLKEKGTMENLIVQAKTPDSELSRLLGIVKKQATTCAKSGYTPQELFQAFSELTLPDRKEI